MKLRLADLQQYPIDDQPATVEAEAAVVRDASQPSTFRTRKAEADARPPRPRRLLSLGVIEMWQQEPGRDGKPVKLEFESLIDLDSRTSYRRYRSDPNRLYPNHDDTSKDVVTDTFVISSNTSMTSTRFEPSPDDKRTLLAGPDW